MFHVNIPVPVLRVFVLKEARTMFLMAVQRYPISVSDQVGKIAVELLSKPPPDYYKRIGPYVGFDDKGVKAYLLYDIESGREGEAFKYLVDVYAAYRVVEGYSIEFEPLLGVEEALSVLGLKL